MATPLGGSGYVGLTFPVINTTAALIKRGVTVCYNGTNGLGDPVLTFLDKTRVADFGTVAQQQLDIPLMPCKLTADSGVAGSNPILGTLLADLPVGKAGLVVAFGMVKVLTQGAIALGTIISTDAAGLAFDGAIGSQRNPFGVILEASTAANQLKWAIVNTIVAWVGIPDGNAQTQWFGKVY